MNALHSLPVPKSKKARSLKSRLDDALSKYRSQVPLWPTLDFNDPEYEVKVGGLLTLAKARKNNKELLYLYHLGEIFDGRPERLNPQSKNHIVGIFLYNYFCGEGGALAFLEDVTMHTIFYLSSLDRNTILLLKPACVIPMSPLYEPQEPDWSIAGDFALSPLNRSLSPQHPLSASEMWRTSPDPTLSLNKRRYDDAEDLEEYDGPLFLTRPLDPALLATSSLLPPSGTPDPKYQETSSRSGFIKRRHL
jgi:hypothetical protein